MLVSVIVGVAMGVGMLMAGVMGWLMYSTFKQIRAERLDKSRQAKE